MLMLSDTNLLIWLFDERWPGAVSNMFCAQWIMNLPSINSHNSTHYWCWNKSRHHNCHYCPIITSHRIDSTKRLYGQIHHTHTHKLLYGIYGVCLLGKTLMKQLVLLLLNLSDYVIDAKPRSYRCMSSSFVSDTLGARDREYFISRCCFSLPTICHTYVKRKYV